MAFLAELWPYQPFKALYVLGTLFFGLTRLPYWLLKYTFVRQHPTWTFRQALALRITRVFISTLSTIRTPTPHPLTPGKEGDRFVLIKSKEEDKDKFKGPMLANAETVQPTDIGGLWYPQRLTADEVEKGNAPVILHIHGGAYVLGSGRSEYIGALASSLLKIPSSGGISHVLCPSYRLSTLPASSTSNPFPAALEDALTSYLYLLHELKIPARRIILSGDSAGANCAIALLRYIAEYGEEVGVPEPSAALLWSPWVNPTDPDTSFAHTNPHYLTDYISPAFLTWGVSAFAGQNPPLRSPSVFAGNPYANAKVKPFKTEVPLFVNVGGAEVLFFDGKEWAESMEKEGNDVLLDVTEGVCHDLFMVSELLGMEKEAEEMRKNAGLWLTVARRSCW